MGTKGYDVFLSYSGEDRPAVRELRNALVTVGVRTFMDEHDIRFSHSISEEIQQALRTSKTMLVYYSESFSGRSACQFELHHAYLSALRTGEVEQRILVINPDNPKTHHLMPLELAAHRYFTKWGTRSELAAIVSEVRTRARALRTPFSGIDFSERAATRQTSPGAPTAAYVGRYRDRWAIHSALHRGEHPLVHAVTAPPVAALTGMSGIGKTALAKVYVHDFGFLYRGGTHRITLTGAGASPDRVRATHTAQLVELARTLGQDLPDRSRANVLAWWNARLAAGGGPALWIVDDVPRGVPDHVLAELVPRVDGVHTLLIGQHEFPPSLATRVRLRAMTADDGHELFTRDRSATAAEARAIDDLVDGLGGHPFTILFAAAAARGRDGPWELDERVRRLTTDATVLDRALHAVRDAIDRLATAERAVLGLSAVCGEDPLPATLIGEVLAAFARTAEAGAVLANLDRTMLIDLVEGTTSWQVHQLVRQAARLFLPPSDLSTIAAVAAHALLAAAAGPVPAEHAAALLEHTADSPAYSTGLNLLAARDYDRRGEPALAARFHENLHALHPDEVEHLLAAARTRQAAGHLAQARAHLDALSGRTTPERGLPADALPSEEDWNAAGAALLELVATARLPSAPRIAVAHGHALVLLGRALTDRGDQEDAGAVCLRVLASREVAPDPPETPNTGARADRQADRTSR
ncbi:TIR domain-containing protein [Umezawaea sp.]|uniref:TIR domain-containing protein n=1 Tax=Umezawaea sp. TaxID=1955258 RepID=UPI002ED57EAF